MPARISRVTGLGPVTYTVVGPDHLPLGPVEEYLRYLRHVEASVNTVRAYAKSLAEWFTFLEQVGEQWTGFRGAVYGSFLTWLRTGDLPGVSRIGPVPQVRRPGTVKARSAAVLAFYRWHAAEHGLEAPYRVLYSAQATSARRGPRRRNPYVGFLDGIAHAPVVAQRYPVRSGPARRTPTLTPAQIAGILAGCARFDPVAGAWRPGLTGLRDRLLFALLIETGMRLGEALTLRHADLVVGRGSVGYVEVVPRQDHPVPAVRVKDSVGRRILIGADLEALYAEYVWGLVDAGADAVVGDLDAHFVLVNTMRGELFAPLRPETVYDKVASLTRTVPGLPAGWSPHWMRHTHASALLLAGVPEHVVMRRLGHADVQTTLSTYGWVTEDAEMRALADWKSFTAGWKGLAL